VLQVAPTAGARFFGDIGLTNELSMGLRVGLGVGQRLTIWTDMVYSQPTGTASERRADVSALRLLAQVQLTRGVLTPYVLGGFGGILFDYGDRTDAAFGTLTGGGGVRYRAGTRTALFAEGSFDLYRSQTVFYTSYGSPEGSTERLTHLIGSITAGIAVEF
jgi:hypothetical protein